MQHDLHVYVLHKINKLLQQGMCHYDVGLSGGIDSIVLLHILHTLHHKQSIAAQPWTLSATHVNHGISSNSEQWSQFCHNYCQSLNIPLRNIKHCVTRDGGESLENNARKIRYQDFIQSEAQVIVLAHHQDDQIETTLSQIFRGSDLHNVAGMHENSVKSNKIIWRPLLNIAKSDIQNYAQTYSLPYITDESNVDTQYLRNFIRQIILPQLQQFDATIGSKINNFILTTQQTLAMVDDIAEQDLAIASNKDKPNAIETVVQYTMLDITKISHLSESRQYNLLTYYIKQYNIALPSRKQLYEFIRQAHHSNLDKTPRLKLNATHDLIKFKNGISIVKK